MIRAHKVALDPNRMQERYFAQACGVSRFAYNWALAEWKRLYGEGEKPSEIGLRKALNAIKKTQFPWMADVTKCAPQQAIKDLGTAYKRFFKKQGKFPRFKKKGLRDSFRADNGPATKGADAVLVNGKRINLPKIGSVKMRETLRFSGQVKSVVISRVANRWFAAIMVDTEDPLPHTRKSQGVVGVDLGVKTLATLSTGEKIEGPKAHKRLLARLRRLSRSLSRKKKGSANRHKAKQKLARLHARITNIRSDAAHKLTTGLVLRFDLIGLETLNVKGMASNRKLARSVMDGGFYELKRQLLYKAQLYGAEVVEADQWFPSTKMCSTCGETNREIVLGVERWTCPSCGVGHDRDVNAALNLMNLAASSAASACGEERSGRKYLLKTKRASVKQEEKLRS